jgi:transposase-like protein
MIAAGINESGHREILGLMLGDTESEESWTEFFISLKNRGLRGMELLVSDNHSGLVKAVRKQFQGVTWQRCQTHFMRNVLGATPKHMRNEIYQKVRAILDAPDIQTARYLQQQFSATYEDQLPRVVSVVEQGFDDVTAVLVLPDKYRKRLRTTNSMERLNEEIRRRERVIRIFPNRESVIRLLGALLMELDEKWASGRRYLDMDDYFEWRQANPIKQLHKVTQIR